VGPRARGESPRGGGSTEARVQARARANRCASGTLRRQTRGAHHSILSGTARCWVGVAERPRRLCASSQGRRYDRRRPGSFLHPLSTSRGFALPHGGGRWDDPGNRVKPAPRILEEVRGGSYRSAWIRRDGARVRHRTSEDGTIFGEGSSSRRNSRPSARGSHPGRREASPCRKLGRGSSSPYGGKLGRGCIEVGSAEAGVSE